jgi:hypothetical protein
MLMQILSRPNSNDERFMLLPWLTRRLPTLAPALALAFLLPGLAQAGSVDLNYAVSLAGIPIGVATLDGEVGADRYRLKVGAKLSGLASMVSDGKGAAEASGALVDGRVLSAGYALIATNTQMSRTIQIGMSAGDIYGVKVEPPFEEKADRIPVTAAQKRGVLDPVSALVMPMRAENPLNPANCDRSLPVFDGSQRFNVVLSYSGTKTVKTASHHGPVLVCKARYIPVSGHRPARKTTKYMADNRDMEAWLVPIAGTRVLIPYRIAVKTMIGTTIIEAQRSSGLASTGR